MPKTRAQRLSQVQNQPSARELRAQKRDEVRAKMFAPIKMKKELVKVVKKEDVLKQFQRVELFQTGALVFAKYRGSRPWPAEIVAAERFPRYKVLFFGSENYGTVSFGGLHLFCESTNAEFGQMAKNPKSKYMRNFIAGINRIKHLHSSK